MVTQDPVELPTNFDPFERRVALTIAILGVALALISTIGDNAQSESLLAATRASSQWAYFQSKSIKEHTYRTQADVLAISREPGAADLQARYVSELERYGREKDEIRASAEAQEAIVAAEGAINDRCDQASLLLQVGIVLGSISILVRWPLLWFVSIGLGLGGAALGVVALLS